MGGILKVAAFGIAQTRENLILNSNVMSQASTSSHSTPACSSLPKPTLFFAMVTYSGFVST